MKDRREGNGMEWNGQWNGRKGWESRIAMLKTPKSWKCSES